MREYGRVHSAFWSSSDVQSLSDDAKMLALYLLSCTHGTIAGAFRMPDGYVSEDLKWTPQRVQKGFQELLRNGFANRCETTKWVWIRKFLQWNPAENPNQWKAVWKVSVQVPTQCAWRPDFVALLSKLTGQVPPPEANPCETLSEPFLNHIPSQPNPTASQQELSPSISASATPAQVDEPEWFSEFKAIYPPRAGDQGWRKALKAGQARIAEGHLPIDLTDGARRYAEFCRATQKIGTEFVKQASTFLGPDKPFLQPWHMPSTKADIRLAGNLTAAQEFMRRTEPTQ